MNYYPIFLDLRGKECLVVGAGGVGQRKILSLAMAGPMKILVVDPYVEDDFFNKMPECVVFEKRKFLESDINGKFLVVVATDNEDMNRYISELCKKNNILCNVVDRPELCSFIVPAIIDKGSIKIAISTSGKSPAMARYIKEKLLYDISPEIVILTEILGRIRSYVIGIGLNSRENKKIFSSFINPKMLDAIKYKDKKYIVSKIKRILPSLSDREIGELLNDIW